MRLCLVRRVATWMRLKPVGETEEDCPRKERNDTARKRDGGGKTSLGARIDGSISRDAAFGNGDRLRLGDVSDGAALRGGVLQGSWGVL